jgi:signal transduction histidine kinase
MLSPAGLGRFAPGRFVELTGRRPARTYTRRDGVPGDRVNRLYEDRRGDVWIGADLPPPVAGLARWDRRSDRIEPYPQVTAGPGSRPSALQEDANGNLWVGFVSAGLGRLRDGRFELLPAGEQGAPKGSITAIHRDDRGRLWVGSNEQGLTLVEDPSSERPRFRRFTTAHGLASNNVRCVTTDREGRVYAGTVRGIDRLDPETGRVRRYSTVDGLPNAFVIAALRDGHGRLWFGTRGGLARLSPPPPRPASPPPPVWIRSVRIGGVAQAVPHLGVPALGGLVVPADRNQVQIDFLVAGRGARETVYFQHQIGAGPWSTPSEERSVQFSSLPPGDQRFLARTVDALGVASAEPARVELTVLPTLWQRRSVHLLLAAGLAGLLYALHRSRLRHALSLERVRTRIASDLHDDIGANLSQIAILSELVRRQAGPLPPEPLEQIASLSRESVDSMGDIVWAIDPRRDSLQDLSQRMRQHAVEVLGACNIRFDFQGPREADEAQLGPELRRQLFLVFKEAVSNLARHSGCSAAEISLRREGGELVLRVHDDGTGLHPLEAQRGDGHGLRSMAARAREMGGSLEIAPANGRGTLVLLRAPLRAPGRPRPYADA